MSDRPLIGNPFTRLRAEDFGDAVGEYYVPGPFEQLLGTRPLVIEGGRGTGKTMFFLSHAWTARVRELENRGKSAADILKRPEIIGLYYRVDSPFTGSLEGKGLNEEDWTGIFSAYLTACLLLELHRFLEFFVRGGVLEKAGIEQCLSRTARSIGLDRDAGDLEQFRQDCNSSLDAIEQFVNAPHLAPRPRPAVSVRPLLLAIDELARIPALAAAQLHVFIDEYESLLDYQQRVVNTLIKQRDRHLVIDIGLRPKGMRTNRTTTPAEVIQHPDDFNLFQPEQNLIGNPDAYHNLLAEICGKLLRSNHVPPGPEGLWHDIRWYLGKYDVDLELERLSKAQRQAAFLSALEEAIEHAKPSPRDKNEAIRLLAKEAPLPHARLHLCLMLRSPKYRPTVDALMNDYRAFLAGHGPRYAHWLHNTKWGLVFLLCRDLRRHKEYFGYDVYAMLSSGIVRYFLELCEQAFKFALNHGLDLRQPRPISIEDQAKAARLVSRLKIQAIDSYEPHGAALKRLVLILGGVLEALHKNPNATLGEPEINHFSTEDTELDPDVRRVLDGAIMWAVLQEAPSTKEKEVEIPLKSRDFHLNHIYCPYFEISYRRKRKVNVPSHELRRLIRGDLHEAKAVARWLLDRHRASPIAADEGASLASEQMPLLSAE